MKIMRAVLLLAVLAGNLVAADSRSVSLWVRVIPDALVTAQGSDMVGVKIRLSAIAQAQLWIADSCTVASPASRPIPESGTYAIPISTLPGTGHMVCLASPADGLLESAPLNSPVLEAVHCTNSTCYLL